jgi:hypothetical protein
MIGQQQVIDAAAGWPQEGKRSAPVSGAAPPTHTV